MIAYRAKADILPVFIDGEAGKTKSFRRNRVIFGKVIPYAELEAAVDGKRDYQALTEYAFSKVCELKYGEGNGALIKDSADSEEENDG